MPKDLLKLIQIVRKDCEKAGSVINPGHANFPFDLVYRMKLSLTAVSKAKNRLKNLKTKRSPRDITRKKEAIGTAERKLRSAEIRKIQREEEFKQKIARTRRLLKRAEASLSLLDDMIDSGKYIISE